MKTSRLEKCGKVKALTRVDRLDRILLTDEKTFTVETTEEAESTETAAVANFRGRGDNLGTKNAKDIEWTLPRCQEGPGMV